MAKQKLKLTYEQLGYIMEQTNISDPKQAIVYFAEIMKKEGIKTKLMSEAVAKLMEKQRKQIK